MDEEPQVKLYVRKKASKTDKVDQGLHRVSATYKENQISAREKARTHRHAHVGLEIVLHLGTFWPMFPSDFLALNIQNI